LGEFAAVNVRSGLCDLVWHSGPKSDVHTRPECNSMIAKWVGVDCAGSGSSRRGEAPGPDSGRHRLQI